MHLWEIKVIETNSLTETALKGRQAPLQLRAWMTLWVQFVFRWCFKVVQYSCILCTTELD